MKNGGMFLKGFCSSVAFALLMANMPVYATETDNIIESAAKESYIFKNYLQDDNITVASKDGIVTLTGIVLEESHKTLAQEIVESIVGVVVVDNQLEIKTQIAKSSDALIFSRVRLAVMSHSALRGIDVRFIVQNGDVTISGMAINTAQIDLTTEYVRDVEGVKNVINEMGVNNEQPEVDKTLGEKAGEMGKKIGDKVDGVGKKIGHEAGNVAELIDDGSITAMVKAMLMYHRSTSALKTKVGTRDGVVTLSGTAKNESARELATQVARNVHGVRGVNNSMALETVQ